MGWETKSFGNKYKLKQLMTTKALLDKILKTILQTNEEERQSQ
jgi:hypothetical protein